MVCSLKIGESNKLIGWVYESNREKVKQATKDLDDFYREDALNDLQQTKDKELKVLDERINNWNKYLTALKQRYDAWQVQEEQKLLMELTNAKTEEELHQKILDDMMNYNEKAAGHYDDYIGIFKDFLDDYKTNLEKLQELKELEREYMTPDYYINKNDNNFSDIYEEATGKNTSKKTLDLSIDYSAEMEKAIAAGDLTQAKYLQTLRDQKADILDITLGQDNYRTNDKVIDDAMKKFGMTNGGIVKNASTTTLDNSVDYALEIQKAIARGDYDDAARYADLRTQKAEEKKITLGTGAYKSNDDIIKEALNYYGVRYTEDKEDGTGYLASNGNATKLLNQATSTNAKTETIKQNVELVAQAADKAGYKIDSVGSIIASQIAASSAKELTQEQANALVQQMLSTGISNDTASLVNSSNEMNKLMSAMGGSIDKAIEYLGKMDTSQKKSLNNSYTSGSGSSGGNHTSHKTTSSSSSSNWNNRDISLEIKNAVAKGDIAKANSLNAERNAKIDAANKSGSGSGSGEKKYSSVSQLMSAKGWAGGIENGPVTYTGLAMLHGTPSAPEYVLNNDQAYNLLYNMSSARMAEFESTSRSNGGVQYIVQGDIILEGIDDPSQFWQEVTTAMGNRWNVTKNK